MSWISRAINTLTGGGRSPSAGGSTAEGSTAEALAGAAGAQAPAAAVGTSPTAAGPVQADALKQMSTAIGWLIAALAAVATAMIAGSQLSSLGQLSASTDGSRLWLAVGGVAGAIALVLVAIGLLYRVQFPANTDFARLCELAEKTGTHGVGGRVRKQVAQDSSLHRGCGSLPNLMEAVRKLRSDFYDLKQHSYEIERRLVTGGPATGAGSVDKARLERVTAELEVVDQRLAEYRRALGRVADLDKYLRTRARYRNTAAAVVPLAALAALGFVTFAWAANPPKAAADAADQRATAAQLVVFATARDAVAARLGDTCTAAAMTSPGIPVIALHSGDDGVEIVIEPSSTCPDAARFVVAHSDGTVLANPSASAGG